MSPDEQIDAALAPTRDAMLAAAGAEAAAVLADADADAADIEARAREDRDRQVAAARADGEREARAALDLALRQARRTHRDTRLQLEREAYEDLRTRIRAAARDLRDDPGYPALLAGLSTAARQVLGPDADIDEAPSGGIVGHVARRRIDLSLDVLADRALASCPDAVVSLWAQ
ncbi:MAG TPA: hypothetical protein VLR26_12940 [Frankiaceae bacterium]|nr:hypothetical protein [Frankiaceae bacterium]